MIQRLPQHHICLGLGNSFCCPFGSKVLLKLVQASEERTILVEVWTQNYQMEDFMGVCVLGVLYSHLMYSNMLTVLWKSRTYSNSVFLFHGADSMNSNSEDNSVRLWFTSISFLMSFIGCLGRFPCLCGRLQFKFLDLFMSSSKDNEPGSFLCCCREDKVELSVMVFLVQA